MNGKNPLVLLGVGDVMVKRADPPTMFTLCAPLLRAADFAFGNCESTYAEKGVRHPMTRGMVIAPPANIEGLSSAGFDVMSFANNHHMDAGDEAFFSTLSGLRGVGIATCGAGANIEEARRPAILERDGVKVAFLGYSSILFDGYEATTDRPGCAPLRVRTTYTQVEIEQPGSPPHIYTEVLEEDLEAMLDDVRRAKEQADVVVVTPHWGLHFKPAVIAEYETTAAQAAIDAGADIVLGHHQHIVKPIQTYKGKVIFHGLGNFAMDVNMSEHAASPHIKEMVDQYPEHAVGYRADYPTYPFHPLARMTMFARCEIAGGTISRVSYIPAYINSSGQPEPLSSADPRFTEIARYIADITAEVGLETKFTNTDSDVEILV